MAFVVRIQFPGARAYLNRKLNDTTYSIKLAAVFATEEEAKAAKARADFPFGLASVAPLPADNGRRTRRDTDA
jgi:hypothetical protein